MNIIDFSFEKTPWETFLDTKQKGDTISAVHLLTVLESEQDDSVDDVFDVILQKELNLDISELSGAFGYGEAALRLKWEKELVGKGFHIGSMQENDPLRLYLEELSAIPSCGDEDILASQSALGDASAMTMLTNLGLSRVVEIAKQHVGYGVLLLDLIQEGSLGLWQGIQSYTKGNYRQHRDFYIRSAMARAVLLQARSGGIGQKMRSAMQDYRSIDERLLAEFGRNPTLEEIALEMHVSIEEAETVKKMLDDAFLLQQAENYGKQEEETEEEQAVEDTAYFRMRQRIQELLSVLDEKDAKILTLRFGLEKGLPLTPEETGRKLGMTADEVTSREMMALSLLRMEK